jgi:hypothetical protein
MGFAPLWDEQFSFKIYCPELAFITIIVKDESGIIYGEYAVRFINMRRGSDNFTTTTTTFTSTTFIQQT